MGMKPVAAALMILSLIGCESEKKYNTLSHYKGSPESIQYSSLTEIDTTNVKDLQIAWVYNTGDADTVHHSQIQCNPIVVDGWLYGTSPQMKLFAIDAATGKQKWVFDPFDSLAIGENREAFFILNNSRGVAYWSDGKSDKRIFYTAGSNL